MMFGFVLGLMLAFMVAVVAVGVHGNSGHALVHGNHHQMRIGGQEPVFPCLLELHPDAQPQIGLGQSGHLGGLGLVGVGIGPGRDQDIHPGQVPGDALHEIGLGRDGHGHGQGGLHGLGRGGRQGQEQQTGQQNANKAHGILLGWVYHTCNRVAWIKPYATELHDCQRGGQRFHARCEGPVDVS